MEKLNLLKSLYLHIFLGGSISATKLREAINIANIRQATLFQLMMDNGESIDK